MNQLTLTIIPIHQLSKQDKIDIIDLCSRAYWEDYAPVMETFEGSTHILARLNDGLVSHACWVERWLQVGPGSLMRTAYVEGVATEESYRGRGFATTIMESLAKEIIDFEIGGLSPAETSLYSRLGWISWQGPLFHRKDGALIRDPEDEEMMFLKLPKTPDLDISLPISIEWREGEIW